MPSGKSRSKEDTWKADELQKSLKEATGDKGKRRDGEEREKRHRRRDDNDGKERGHRDKDINREEKDRRRKKREGEENGAADKERGHKPKDDEDKRRNKENDRGDERRRHHRDKDGAGGEDGERKHGEGEDREERRRRRKDGDGEDNHEKRRRHREEDGEDRKHRVKDGEGGEDREERRRRRKEREGGGVDLEKEDGEDRQKSRKDGGDGKDRERDERRRRKEGETEEEREERRRRRKDREGESEEQREERRRRKEGETEEEREERHKKRKEKEGENEEERAERRRRRKEGDTEEEREDEHRRRKEREGETEQDREERRRRRKEGETEEEREERRRRRKEGETEEEREERRRRRKERDGETEEQREERRRRRKEKEGDDEGKEEREERGRHREEGRERRQKDKDDSGSRSRRKDGDNDDDRKQRHRRHRDREDRDSDGDHRDGDVPDSGAISSAVDGGENLGDGDPGDDTVQARAKEVATKEQAKEPVKQSSKTHRKLNKNPSPMQRLLKPAKVKSNPMQEVPMTRAKSSAKPRASTNVVQEPDEPIDEIDEEIVTIRPVSGTQKTEAAEDDYGDYEDDFEDYDDDFEDEDNNDEDDEPKASRDELDDLFRAMNEENDRLLASSRKSNWSDSTEVSEEHSKPARPVTGHHRTFINFVSAKQRQVTQKAANKTRRRGQELLQLIELDTVQFSMFDMPPVNEYELYMRSFGRSDTKQCYVQTNEDNLDREIQTEEVDSKQRWTQHPPEDFAGCGGDDDGDDDEIKAKEMDSVRFSKFLQRASQTILLLLEEENTERSQGEVRETQSTSGFSQGFLPLETPPILQGRSVVYSCFSPVQTNLLLTVHSRPITEQNSSVDRRGFICLWNLNEPSTPTKYLVCESQPTCCCFSPSKATLVFAGMVDGSLVVWDLRESTSLHHTLRLHGGEWSLRNPTYSTAGVLGDENHHSAVTTVLPIVSTSDSAMSSLLSNEDVGSGLSFQLASLEENSIVHLWVVAEISNPDAAGSESDLGLSPGGRIKLLKSSSITLANPISRDSRVKAPLRASQMKLLPSNPNHYYVGTDSGMVLHGSRHGGKVVPKVYKQEIDSPVNVTSIDFSPFNVTSFLAGLEDGSVAIYSLTNELPAVVWPSSTNGRAVVSIQWSRSRPCVFYVLDDDSKLHIWDLSQSDVRPVKVEQFSSGRLKSFSLSNDHSATGLGLPGRQPQMVLCFDDGKTELHNISETLRRMQASEVEQLKTFLENVI